MKFSERYGHTEPKNVIQINRIDEDLKKQLWNDVYMHYFSEFEDDWIDHTENDQDKIIVLNRLYLYYFKNTLDQRTNSISRLVSEFKDYFFYTKWFNVYNFIEFIVDNCPSKRLNKQFMKNCNISLKEELSAYRFVDGKITPITSEEEIQSIEEAISNSNQFKPVRIHLQTAIDLFANKINPDYRNSIKESISAVESICAIITEDSKAPLGQALKKLEDKGIVINKALKSGFSNLYGYTSEGDGIRHGLMEESNLNQEDARYMLITCSAFINYLIEKYNKIN